MKTDTPTNGSFIAQHIFDFRDIKCALRHQNANAMMSLYSLAFLFLKGRKTMRDKVN